MTQSRKWGSGAGAMAGRLQSARRWRTAKPTVVAGILLSAWGAMSCGRVDKGLGADDRDHDSGAAADVDSESAGADATADSASSELRDANADSDADIPTVDDAEVESGIELPDAAPKPTDGGSAALPERIALLTALPAWQDFRALWQRLDEVLPRDDGSSAYTDTITVDERDHWLLELDSSLSAIEQSGALNADELLFLRRATTARIEVMTDGGYLYEMYYHRSPFPFEMDTEDSIARLETKIDTLLTLRARCQIEPDAYQQALEQVESEAITFFTVAQLAGGTDYQATVPEVPEGLEGAELVTELVRRLTSLRDESSGNEAELAEIAVMQERLAVVERTLTVLPLLIRDLERCD